LTALPSDLVDAQAMDSFPSRLRSVELFNQIICTSIRYARSRSNCSGAVHETLRRWLQLHSTSTAR